MSNPWLNAEGYNDPTAYKAIKNLEENRMRANEIWKVEGPNKSEMQVLVLSVHDSYCSDIVLADEEPSENSMKFGNKYLDLGRCGFHYKDRFIERVRGIVPADAKNVRAAIAEALGVNSTSSSEELVKAKTEATIYQDLYDRLLDKVMTKG